MNTIRVLIIEDEQPASNKLVRLLKETTFDIEVMAVLKSVEEVINWLPLNPPPDLIFMDIQLEDGICFEIFENCNITQPVVFTTAYDEYALKAFKVNSVDYLLKPITLGDLTNALNKYEMFYNPVPANMNVISGHFPPTRKERFLVKIGEHYHSVPVSTIQYFYVMDKCNFIYTLTGKTYPVDFSLDRIEQMVSPDHFFRINRNYIINYAAITDVIAYSTGRLKVKLNNHDKADSPLLVSRERVGEFKMWMDK